MKKYAEQLTNYEIVTLPIDSIGLSEEICREVHSADIHTLGPIIAVDAYALIEQGLSMETAAVVIAHAKKMGITLSPKKNSVGEFDYDIEEENPYEIIYDIVQNEIFEYERRYYRETGVDIAQDNFEDLNLPEDLYRRLVSVGYNRFLIFFLPPSVAFYFEKMRENAELFYEARRYISQTYGIPEKLFFESDEASEKAELY